MTLREIPYCICKDCQYYFGQADSCMVGEEDVPDNLERKCITGKRAKCKILNKNKKGER